MAIRDTYIVYVANGQAVLNKDIYLTRGDEDITLNFEIEDFTFDISECNVVIFNLMSPEGALVTRNGTINNGVLTLTINSTMIDDLEEVGDYALQIIVSDGTSSLSLPIITHQFHVRPTLEDMQTLDGLYPNAIAKDHIPIGDTSTGIFNDDKSYSATEWVGDGTNNAVVQNMNKIENALTYLMDVTVVPYNPIGGVSDLNRNGSVAHQKYSISTNDARLTIIMPEMVGCAYANVIMLLSCSQDCIVTFSGAGSNEEVEFVSGHHFLNMVYYKESDTVQNWMIVC